MLRRVTNVDIEKFDSLGPFRQTRESFDWLQRTRDVNGIVKVGKTADAHLWWVGEHFYWSPLGTTEGEVIDAVREGVPGDSQATTWLAELVRRVVSIRLERRWSWFREQDVVRIELSGDRRTTVHRIVGESDPDEDWASVGRVAAGDQPYDGPTRRVLEIEEGQIWLAKGAVWLMDLSASSGALTRDGRAIEAANAPPSGFFDTLAERGLYIGEAVTVTIENLFRTHIDSVHGEFYISTPENGADQPQFVDEVGGRYFWLADGALYWSDERSSAEDVGLILWDRGRRRDTKLDRLRKIRAGELHSTNRSRQEIPAEVRDFVYNRDGGCCTECGIAEDLQFDHVIPVAKGGGNSAENIQLLCGTCNRRKSDSIA